ncbi:transporter substrate-binding domain-containing protein [Streptomyces laurentii]|uniref:transporter substrate-binding domain-containing protein n=1 Tax=Streptomyces laurentii TaxID=39478 RepID=UPI0036A7B1EE
MHDEERPTHPLRPNARRSAPTGDTPEANELALWLRKCVGARSVRELETAFRGSPKKSQWSELLNGRRLVTEWVLDSVVTHLVPKQHQQVQRNVGHHLRQEAEKADQARRETTSRAAASGSSPHDYELRLDDARRGQIRAQETVQELTHLIYLVMNVVTGLTQQCQSLEAERDQAQLRLQEVESTVNQVRAAEIRRRAAEDQRHLTETEQLLAEATRQRVEAEKRLARALREKQEAEDLQTEASRQADQFRRAFKELTGQDAPSDGDGKHIRIVPAPQPWEYDYFRETADAQLDLHHSHMNSVRELLGVPNPPTAEEVRTIHGQVVPTPSADTTDSATPAQVPSADRPDTHPTSTVPVHGLSADRPDTGYGITAETPPATPENTDRQNDTTPPPHKAGNPKRKATRVTLVSAACLALLAGGGWLTWNHYAEYTPADSGTLKRAEEKKEIVIGVKQDQPGLSETDADGKNAKGFEIDLIRYLLKEIGFQGKIKFKPLASGDREAELNSRDVDLIIASYSINEKREKKVSFSVPYYDTGQTLLMFKGRKEGEFQTWDQDKKEVTYTRVTSLDDLPDRTDSCTVKSTSLDFMESPEFTKKFDINGLESSYRDCIDGLLRAGNPGSYEVISTDDVILAGLAYKYGKGELARTPFIFKDEHYGVGMRKGDPALKYLMCKAIKKSITDKKWNEFYNDHLEKIMGEPANPPTEPTCQGR